MAIIKSTANGETLTRTLAANLIAGLGGNDELFGVDGSDFLHGGSGQDDNDGGFDNATLIRRAGEGCLNDAEVARQRDISAVPLFNIFRPF